MLTGKPILILRLLIIAGFLYVSLPGNHMVIAQEPGQSGSDSLFYFKGRVLDSLTHRPVTLTHIINLGRGTATISDTLGYFFLKVRLLDTLQITAIGYAPTQQVVTDSISKLPVLPDIMIKSIRYAIEGVNINPLGSYLTFMAKVANLELPESKYIINELVLRDIELGLDTLDMMPTASVSPVTALYNWLSKEGKSKRKLRYLIEQEEFEKQISYKYSPLIVSGITGYSEFKLYRFMDFCSFSKKFLEVSDRYVVRDAVLEKQKIFEALEED